MNHAFKQIALFGRYELDNVKETLQQLIVFLRHKNIVFQCEKVTAQALADSSLDTIDFDDLGKNNDLIIVVGGDGSFLQASKPATYHQTPILGINRGRLGFLADIRPNELETRLYRILAGEYSIDQRFLLQSDLYHLGLRETSSLDAGHGASPSSIDCGVALNDVVLSPGKTPHMLEFEIYVDQQFVCSQHADGVMISTPTGSTAYSLSAGGPILHPQLEALIILPMFSHSLTSRPIVVHANSEICIEISAHNETEAQLSCNGGEIILVPPNSQLRVHRLAQTIKLVHPLDYNYYETLRSKLHWGHKL